MRNKYVALPLSAEKGISRIAISYFIDYPDTLSGHSRAPPLITQSPYAGFTRDSRCRISGSALSALPVDRSHSSAAE